MKVIKTVLGLPPDPGTKRKSAIVTNDITKMANGTLVFHLNKAKALDAKRFEKLDCYVVTDPAPAQGDGGARKGCSYVKNVRKAYDKFVRFYRGLL